MIKKNNKYSANQDNDISLLVVSCDAYKDQDGGRTKVTSDLH